MFLIHVTCKVEFGSRDECRRVQVVGTCAHSFQSCCKYVAGFRVSYLEYAILIHSDSYHLYFFKGLYTSPLSNGGAADLKYLYRHDAHEENRRMMAFMPNALLSEAAAVRSHTVRYGSLQDSLHRQEISTVIASTTRVAQRNHDVEISTPQHFFQGRKCTDRTSADRTSTVMRVARCKGKKSATRLREKGGSLAQGWARSLELFFSF